MDKRNIILNFVNNKDNCIEYFNNNFTIALYFDYTLKAIGNHNLEIIFNKHEIKSKILKFIITDYFSFLIIFQ